MGHGHDHSHEKMELPDYKQWKIEGTPLQDVQERLARRGLRDPWGRYDSGIQSFGSGTDYICDELNISCGSDKSNYFITEVLVTAVVQIHSLSNEAWRFMGAYAKPVTVTEVLMKGFKWGFVAFVVALGIEYTLFPPKKNGGHH